MITEIHRLRLSPQLHHNHICISADQYTGLRYQDQMPEYLFCDNGAIDMVKNGQM